MAVWQYGSQHKTVLNLTQIDVVNKCFNILLNNTLRSETNKEQSLLSAQSRNVIIKLVLIALSHYLGLAL